MEVLSIRASFDKNKQKKKESFYREPLTINENKKSKSFVECHSRDKQKHMKVFLS